RTARADQRRGSGTQGVGIRAPEPAGAGADRRRRACRLRQGLPGHGAAATIGRSQGRIDEPTRAGAPTLSATMSATATFETFGDKARAFALALLVHVGVAALLLLGLLLVPKSPPDISLQGPIIEAELVGLTAAPKPIATARPKPAPKAAETPPPVKPSEPVPQPPTQVQRQDRVDREKVVDLAQEKAEQAERAEEERHRQEQVLLEQQQREERDRAKLLEQV